MRFLVACIKDGNEIVKIGMDDGKERWMSTTKAVYGFVKKALKGNNKDTNYPGDEVKVTYTEENGKFHATRIEPIRTGTKPSESEVSTTGHKCADCGKALKDGKYEKCYECNKKNPSKTKKSYGKSPEEIATIKRQAIGHMTSRSLVTLQGHLDPNTIQEVIRSLYKLYIELVG